MKTKSKLSGHIIRSAAVVVFFLFVIAALNAATSSPFATVPEPIGVAAAPTDLLVSEYCSQNLDTVDCFGNVSVLATIVGPVSPCSEKYIAIAPLQSALAVSPWSPRDIFITQGTAVYKASGASATMFATITGCEEDHTGITFDHVGTFGYNMIVTCDTGGVWEIDATGSATLIADTMTELEGPAVAPLSFGPLGGQILVADENQGQIHAIASDGIVTYDVFDWDGAESVQVIPSAPCTFCSGGAFFQAIENFDAIYQYPLTDFTGLGGSILVPSEFGAGTALITFNGTDYVTTFFDNIPGGLFEGSAFADCDVPTPTATPTGTATATPTAAATATATATATAAFSPTPTATATATATPTATVTATATATPTITPTPTPTPTPTATSTPTAAGKVTGGGEITVPGGSANLGFNAQNDHSGPKGQLEYQNHARNLNVHSVSITSVNASGNNAGFSGTCTKNGAPCTFTVSAQDNGEPGTSDRFTIAVSGEPMEGGQIRNGNIQIHN